MKELQGKTILLSGGAGFLGTYFRKALANTECTLISLDTVEHASDAPNITCLTGDVNDVKDLKNIDYIIHAAGFASPYYYDKYPLETIDSAIGGARALLEVTRQTKARFFLFSTSEIYGDPPNEELPTKETYFGNVPTTGPRACYDESKRLAETITDIYQRKFGVDTVVVRPFNVYGPGMRPNDYRVVPTFIHNALNGKPLPVFAKGKQTRSFCYVTDAMDGFFAVLTKGKSGETYNVGNDEREITMKELAEEVVSIVPDAKIEFIADAPGYSLREPQRRLPDISKIRELGYEPKVSLREGLTKCIDYARTIH